MQGWRISMEDAHTHILSLNDDPTGAFFGVFDGHGGTIVGWFELRYQIWYDAEKLGLH